MTDQSITLSLSETMIGAAKALAEATGQSLESVLRQRLEDAFRLPTLPADEEAELVALRQLADATLWTIAAAQVPMAAQTRLTDLLARHKRAGLRIEEQDELDALLLAGDQLMVRKAEAAAILTERGHRVTPDDLAGRAE